MKKTGRELSLGSQEKRLLGDDIQRETWALRKYTIQSSREEAFGAEEIDDVKTPKENRL